MNGTNTLEEETDTEYKLAQTYLQKEDASARQIGFLHLQRLAEQGHVKALYNLGICLHEGIGCTASKKEALSYFQKAAEKEHPRSIYMLGVYALMGFGEEAPSEEKALRFLKEAASRGVVDAQYNLGVLLLQNNDPEAIQYFKQAAEQESADALYNLGVCYADGIMVSRSRGEAIEYLERAVKLKHEKAAEALEKVLMKA